MGNPLESYCRVKVNGNNQILMPDMVGMECENRDERVSQETFGGQEMTVHRGDPICPPRNLRIPLWTVDNTPAKKVYDWGMEALKNGLLGEAECHFRDVMQNEPQSRYAAYSQLRLADVSLAHGRECEAVTRYLEFMDKYPFHPEVLNCYVTSQLIIAVGRAKMKNLARTLTSPAEQRK